MAKVILSPDVEEDLLVIADYIADDSPDAADRFIEAAYGTFTRLFRFPGMGRPRKFRASRLKGLRSFRVADFEEYLIFYSPTADRIEVYRVIHGAMDLERLFEE